MVVKELIIVANSTESYNGFITNNGRYIRSKFLSIIQFIPGGKLLERYAETKELKLLSKILIKSKRGRMWRR
jgi:hypothetical protein